MEEMRAEASQRESSAANYAAQVGALREEAGLHGQSAKLHLDSVEGRGNRMSDGAGLRRFRSYLCVLFIVSKIGLRNIRRANYLKHPQDTLRTT